MDGPTGALQIPTRPCLRSDTRPGLCVQVVLFLALDKHGDCQEPELTESGDAGGDAGAGAPAGDKPLFGFPGLDPTWIRKNADAEGVVAKTVCE